METSVYDSWGTGEPNNAGEEDCALVTLTGSWNDFYCTWTHYILCSAQVMYLISFISCICHFNTLHDLQY